MSSRGVLKIKIDDRNGTIDILMANRRARYENNAD